MLPVGALTLFLLLAGCSDRGNAVSGTIEVDEVHVGPRIGGRVEKIFAQEGDRLHEGQPIVQLEASELRARRDLGRRRRSTPPFTTPMRRRRNSSSCAMTRSASRICCKRKVVSPTDAERADSAAKAQEKNVEAAKMRVAQARAQLADIDAQLAEMQVIAPGGFRPRSVERKSGRRSSGQPRSRRRCS